MFRFPMKPKCLDLKKKKGKKEMADEPRKLCVISGEFHVYSLQQTVDTHITYKYNQTTNIHSLQIGQ